MAFVTRSSVLIDVPQGALADRLERTLADEFVVGQSAGSPTGVRWDLVVSERPHALETLGLGVLGEPDAALLVIGPDDPRADASLAPDFSDRELLLACRVLGRMVLWRRVARHTEAAGRQFEQLAHTDPLTRVANRRAWDRELPGRITSAQSASHALCLALFDVDRFKSVNDQQGHPAGDRVLATLGPGLADAVRAGDFVARLGGDEFAALLVGNFDLGSAGRVIERIRQGVVGRLAGAGAGEVTVSAGCAVAAVGAALAADELFAIADAALGEAKRAGRNCTVSQIAP